MRNVALVASVLIVGLLSSMGFGQCANGVCQMRTPLRSAVANIAEAKPVRSVVRNTAQLVRPSNWRVFNQGVTQASCSGLSSVPVQSSCGGVSSSPVYSEVIYEQVVISPVQGPVASPVVEDQSSVVEAFGFRSDRVAFRRALKQATKNAVASGSMSETEAAIVNSMAFFPGRADSMMAAIQDMAVDQGLATAQGIDWDGLAGFLERIMPLILKLIELFGDVRSVNFADGLVLHFDSVSVEILLA